MASRRFGMLGTILEISRRHRIVATNPARGVRRYPDEKRRRFLSSDELVAFGKAMREAEAEGEKRTGKAAAHDGTTYKYLAKRRDCEICPLKPKCTKGKERRLARDVDEPIRDLVRALFETPAFKHSRDQRKNVEIACAHMKRIFKVDRLRLRGLSGARDEILLTATAQNLRKLAGYVTRPPPSTNPA